MEQFAPSLLFWIRVAAAVGIAYLVGSLSPAYLVVRRHLGQDIRRLGDGNAGTENVARLAGLKPAILVAAIDVAKGLLAVLLVRLALPVGPIDYPLAASLSGDLLNNGIVLAVGAAAVIGHSWSIYLKGYGGRGAATAAGALLGMVPLPAFLMILPSLFLLYRQRSATWCLASFFIGIVFLTALLGYFGYFGYTLAMTPYTVALPALVAVIHCQSLRRPRARAARAAKGTDPNLPAGPGWETRENRRPER